MSGEPPSRAPVGRGRLTLALFLPAAAWFLFQQGSSATMRARCAAAAPPIGLVWGVASLLLCVFAAWLALPASRPSDLEGRQVPRFLAVLALIGAGIFALAIVFQTLAILVIPPCVG
jgi:hypothetical protein